VKLNEASPRLLLILSTIAVLLLLFFSDFSPSNAGGFLEASQSTRPVEVDCLVGDCKVGEKGTLLDLTDIRGKEVRGFCPNGTLGDAIAEGTVLTVTCQATDDPDFFIILSARRQGEPEGGELSFYACQP